MILSKISNYFISEVLHIRLKPQTLQMPITGKCNSKCITCNIWKQHKRIDMSADELKKIVADPYFSNVENVGINGGEPFLHSEFEEIIRTITTLPSIERIYLISNGLLTNRIIEKLKSIKEITMARNVKLYLTISLDGIDNKYTDVRGIAGGFNRVKETLYAIKSDMESYCDSLTIGTTVSIENVDSLKEIDSFATDLSIPVNYHIAVPNRRIYTNEDSDRYSVLCDELARLKAIEFFYGRFKKSKTIKEKLLYFQNYYYLHSNGRRVSSCTYKKQDLTIDENFNLYYCAKESKKIGNLTENKACEILNKDFSKQEERRICKECVNCGHYITLPTVQGFLLMVLEILRPGVWIAYRYLAKW